MNYYSNPYGGASMDPYYGRIITPTPTGVQVEPPYPSGSVITPQTPNPPIGSVESYLNPTIPQLVKRVATEQSYIENILRLNRGKMCSVHMTFSQGSDPQSRIFVGIIEGAGRDHIVLSDPDTEHRYLLLMVYLDYVEFPEEINYYYPVEGIINIIDEELYNTVPGLMQLKKYKEEYQKIQEEQLKAQK
ncbi:MAG: spore coat protein GerQ [Turicibacter sp.]